MPSHTTPDANAQDQAYPAGSMRVERGSTPDGRLLLYFTFPAPDADAGPRDAGRAGATIAATPGTVARDV